MPREVNDVQPFADKLVKLIPTDILAAPYSFAASIGRDSRAVPAESFRVSTAYNSTEPEGMDFRANRACTAQRYGAVSMDSRQASLDTHTCRAQFKTLDVSQRRLAFFGLCRSNPSVITTFCLRINSKQPHRESMEQVERILSLALTVVNGG